MGDLTDLLERVRAAVGPDRELDALIAKHLLGKEVKREPNNRTWRMGHKPTRTRTAEPWVPLPDFMASVDASLALKDAFLPGWEHALEGGRKCCCVLFHPDNEEGEGVFVETAATLPASIVTALLSALIAGEEKQNG